MFRRIMKQFNMFSLCEKRRQFTQTLNVVPLHTNAIHRGVRRVEKRVCILPINQENVESFIKQLEPREKAILINALVRCETRFYAKNESKLVEKIRRFAIRAKRKPPNVVPPTRRQLVALFFHFGLPYLIFGFLDNFMMVTFGDAFDIIMPTGFSFLTCAALGNTVSNVTSVFLAVYIEQVIYKVLRMSKTNLSEAQMALTSVKRVAELSRPICVGLGTILGMWPLYFMNI